MEKHVSASKGLRLFFSQDPINEASHLVTLGSILLKDEREGMPMAILFKDLLEARKIPNGTKYLWVVRPDGSNWEVLKVVELVTSRSIKNHQSQHGRIAAMYLQQEVHTS